MNSFFAMLKDSLREAIDGWIFLVMFILAGVVILFVGSMSTTPVVSDQAIEYMMGAEDRQVLSPDRGQAKKFAIFFFRPSASNLSVQNEKAPWAGPLQFEMEFRSSGFGAAGAEVELDEDKKPKIDSKKVQESLVLGDPFKEAVRYWASKPGEKKPEFTQDLAREYIAEYVQDHTRLKVSEVTVLSEPKPGIMGMFGNAPPPTKYLIKCESGEMVGWAHYPSLFFGLVNVKNYVRPLGNMVNLIEGTLLNTVGGWVLLLAGVIVTSGFIPNMIRKGAIDLLLTKPMTRPAILIYKYLGGLLFVILLTMFAIVGVWLVVGLRTGVWSNGILWAVGGITGYFAILYACSTLLGVLTRNAIVSIVGTICLWFVIWLIGFANNIIQTLAAIESLPQPRQAQVAKNPKPKKLETAPTPKTASTATDKSQPTSKPEPESKEKPLATESEPAEPAPTKIVPDWLVTTAKWANRITPRTGDLDTLTTELIAKDLIRPAELKQGKIFTKDLNFAEVSIVAGAWLTLFLGLALLRFNTRSY